MGLDFTLHNHILDTAPSRRDRLSIMLGLTASASSTLHGWDTSRSDLLSYILRLTTSASATLHGWDTPRSDQCIIRCQNDSDLCHLPENLNRAILFREFFSSDIILLPPDGGLCLADKSIDQDFGFWLEVLASIDVFDWFTTEERKPHIYTFLEG